MRVANTTSKLEEIFGTRLLQTSGDKGVSIIKACMIEEDNGHEAYTVDDVAANDKVKEVFVNNTTRVDDDHGETSSTLDPETWALADVRPKRRKVAAGKERLKPMRITTLRRRWIWTSRWRMAISRLSQH